MHFRSGDRKVMLSLPSSSGHHPKQQREMEVQTLASMELKGIEANLKPDGRAEKGAGNIKGAQKEVCLRKL